ncbi:restriction endonuclease [Cohnella soli]|uniref:Restriction endonuclease n=1 Tax=Cohnella soli TaxID=425005 RepID=A0ABW0I085_9BACL
MKFTQQSPETWRDLQDQISKYLNEAGYQAITPYEIDTARGKVEVDVFIEAPNELVKRIVCECKHWKTRVTKEKIHAFRTVVHDSGAELGIIISKNGYQSGAIEAARYSNIRLETWSSFLDIIKDRWIDNRLAKIKKMTARLMSFTDGYTYESEKLTDDEFKLYKRICHSISFFISQSIMVSKSELSKDVVIINDIQISELYCDIEQYLNVINQELYMALDVLEELSIKPQKTEKYERTLRIYL